jgi:hypothetical protein
VLGSFQVTGTVAVRGSHTPPPLTASGTTCRHRLRQEIGGSKTASSLFSSVSMLLFFLYSLASLFLLLFLMVMVLLSMVAQGSSCGGDEEGKRWCPFLSFLFLPCFCFIPSPFLSFSFSVLCPFVSFLFLSSLSLFLSLPSSSILKQPPPRQASP